MNKTFEKLISLGYVIHNKRVLGKPEHTSIETREKDLIQEYALIVMWLYEKHGVWIEVHSPDMKGDLWYFNIHKPYTFGSYGEGENYTTPTETYEAAIEYTLNNLI